MPLIGVLYSANGFSIQYGFVKVIIFVVALATGIARKRSVCPAGFISRGDGDDLFVHYSEIEMDGYKTLDEGQPVEFEITTGQNGKLQASSVHKI